MTSFDPFESAPTIMAIPQKCEGCAELCELRRDLTVLKLSNFIMTEMGSRLMGEEFDNFISQYATDENTTKELVEFMRIEAGDELHDIDEAVEQTETRMKNLSETCNGRFKIRAPRHGVMYTATICTSPLAYGGYDGELHHVATHVQAEIVEQ